MLDLITLPFLFASRFVRSLGNRQALIAENLFLRRQLALYIERNQRPRRANDATRLALVLLCRLFNWRDALVIVRPETLVRWHRQGFRLLWRRKSRPGRPPIPAELRKLIVRIASENPLWGEERIAAELLLKLGIRVSPRTVRRYMPKDPLRRERKAQSWETFFRNHAKGILACDFLTVVTARFRVLYVLVILDVEKRSILHTRATSRPTAGWAVQQFREALPWEHGFERLVHDRDSIFSCGFDESLENMGLEILRTPPRTPTANAHCERIIGTLRQECLDHVIPLSEGHLGLILKEWVGHYNRGRPHSSLGPGLPDSPAGLPVLPLAHRHRLSCGPQIRRKSILGGLHHEYFLEPAAGIRGSEASAGVTT